MKTCASCKEKKERSQYYKSKYLKDGLYSYCKKCHMSRYTCNPKKRWRQKARTDKVEHILSLRWLSLRSRRGEYYSHVKLNLTKEEFFKEMDNLELRKLLKEWKDSGFSNRLTPSVDRIDPLGNYERGNIRWLPSYMNSKLARKTGHRAKKVYQVSKDDGSVVAEFSSATAASLALFKDKKHVFNIRASALGKIPSAYGYIWKDVN